MDPKLIMVEYDLINEIISEVRQLKLLVAQPKTNQFNKEHFYLKEACELKGVNYKSLCTEKFKHLRPNNGVQDLPLNNRAAWRKTTIEKWITQSDDDLVLQLKASIGLKSVIHK